MDPLSVLREFSVGKMLDQVVVDANRVMFGERYSFPKNVATGYRRHGGGTYDLQTLVYLLKQPANYAWLNYVRSAREANIPQVAFPDRKDLQDYLSGATDRSDKIQLAAPELVLPSLEKVLTLQASDAEPSAKRARLDAAHAPVSGANLAPDASVGLLASRERQLRDRNSQMSIPGKSFKQVLEILHMAQREQATWKAKPPPLPKASQEKRQIQPLPSDRFNRPAEQNPRSAFKIQPAGPPPGAPPLPPGPLPDAQRAPAPPQTGSQSRSKPHPLHAARGPARPSGASAKEERARRPIIIVPAAPSSKITMLNVKPFLEKGLYTPNEVARKEGVKKVSSMIVHRRLGRSAPVAYEVTDKAPETRSHDWRRVVAVFVTGQAWQFKGWPHKGAEKGEMADAFHAILGVHISLKTEQLSDTVKAWNVQRFRLHPVERHGDQPVVMEIFAAIDKFMANQKKSGRSLELLY